MLKLGPWPIDRITADHQRRLNLARLARSAFPAAYSMVFFGKYTRDIPMWMLPTKMMCRRSAPVRFCQLGAGVGLTDSRTYADSSSSRFPNPGRFRVPRDLSWTFSTQPNRATRLKHAYGVSKNDLTLGTATSDDDSSFQVSSSAIKGQFKEMTAKNSVYK